MQRGDTCETFQNVIAFAKRPSKHSATQPNRARPNKTSTFVPQRTNDPSATDGWPSGLSVCVRRPSSPSLQLQIDKHFKRSQSVCREIARGETALGARKKKSEKKRYINQARGAFGKREAQFSRLFWADTVRGSGSRFPGRRVATFRSCPVKKWVFSCVSASLCSVCVSLYATKVTQNFSSPLCCCCVLKFRKTHLLLLFAVRNIFRLIRTRPRRRLRVDLYR